MANFQVKNHAEIIAYSVYKGASIEVTDDSGVTSVKVIDDVECIPVSNKIIFTFTDGTAAPFNTTKNMTIDMESLNILASYTGSPGHIAPTMGKQKGKKK